jgi:hypothetical protein
VLEDFHVVGGEYGLRLGGTPSFAFSKITNVNVKDASVMGVFLQHLVLVIFTNCRFSNCPIDVGSTWSNVNTTVTFIGCHFVWATTAGASILGDVDFIFIECAFEGNSGYGVSLSGCIGFKFLNCWWEGNNGSFGKAGLWIDGYPSDVDKTTKLCTFENCIIDEPSGTATHSIYITRGINNVFRDCKFYSTDFTKYIFCEEGAGGTYLQGNVLQNHYPVRQYDLQMIDCFTDKYQMLIIEYEFDGKYYSNRCNNGMTTVSFCYDFAIHGGGNSALFKIPLGAQITKAFYNVVDALTSDGASKITFGVSSDDTSGLLVTTNYNDAAFTVGYHNFIPDGDVANWTNITTAARYVMMYVATANLTAGKILIHMEYIS